MNADQHASGNPSTDAALRWHVCEDCYLCGSRGRIAEEKVFDAVAGVAGEWSIRECENPGCGLHWVDPQIDVADLGKLYKSYYTHPGGRRSAPRNRTGIDGVRHAVLARAFGYTVSCGGEGAGGGGVAQLVGSLLARSSIARYRLGAAVMWLGAVKNGRLLDVGCGSGGFLRRMSDRGWDVAGIDPDPIAAESARGFGVPVKDGLLEDADFDRESFDAITLIHVIEHLPDPKRTLRVCYDLLRPGGCLSIKTPNAKSWGRRVFGAFWRGWEAPRHLHIFTPDSLAACAAAAGFVVDVHGSIPNMSKEIWRESDRIGGVLATKFPRGARWSVATRKALLWRRLLVLRGFRSESGDEAFIIARRPSDAEAPVGRHQSGSGAENE